MSAHRNLQLVHAEVPYRSDRTPLHTGLNTNINSEQTRPEPRPQSVQQPKDFFC
jgi:hypothetical protein